MPLRLALILDAGIGCSRSAARPIRLPVPARPTLTTTPLRLPSLRALSTGRPSFLSRLPPFPTPKPLLPSTTFSARRFFSTSRPFAFPTHRSRFTSSRNRSSGAPPGGGQGFIHRLKRRLDNTNDNYIIFGLIGINLAVFGMWQYAATSAQRFRDMSVLQAMYENFAVSWPNVKAGRVWTLVTSCFSQSSANHLINNCIGLYFVSGAALSVLGGFGFLSLYLAGGVFTSIASLAWQSSGMSRLHASQGASGAIYATLAFYAMVFPKSTILLFFIIPMPAWVAVAGFMAWDTYSAISRPNSTTDSAGHIGGLLFGIGAAAALRRGRLPPVFLRSRW